MIERSKWLEILLELIRRTSCDLPADVEQALLAAREREKPGSLAQQTLELILQNVALARAHSRPICQDTGVLTFYVDHPPGFDAFEFETVAKEAVSAATVRGYLRPNVVEPLTGASLSSNVGVGNPTFEYSCNSRDRRITVRLLLKGGGCENVSTQYSLPEATLNAHRDVNGCLKVVLDAIFKAQGKGCAPGVVGICIGGDRATGYRFAKRQLLRNLQDENPDPMLADFERHILQYANELGIGPMGYGGATTLLGVKACTAVRVPASFFVTVSYMCWAYRRRGVILTTDGTVLEWI